MTIPLEFKIPDLLSICQFPSSINPQYKRAAKESVDWISSFAPLGVDTHAFFTEMDSVLLAAYVYPYAPYEKFRICCDLINVLFGMDEISDVQDGAGARSTMELHVASLLGEPYDNSSVSRMTTVFRAHVLEQLGPKNLRRFLNSYKSYANAVGKEAEYREKGIVLSLEEYRIFRRENSAVQPCFDVIESCFGIDLPDEVYEDPTFKRIYNAALDMVLWSNDIYSYNMEQSRKGHSCANVVTVIMKEKGFTLQQAVDYAGAEFQALLGQFATDKEALPSFGAAVDADLRNYIFGLENWIVGNLMFSFDTPRYLGEERKEVEKTLIVKLRTLSDVAQ
ncbi:hypothetical protein M0805_002120 [Coniferiporia weirii]|nr:hypothetical protein M0805_002120 [Coniferiporia weirii]